MAHRILQKVDINYSADNKNATRLNMSLQPMQIQLQYP
ncbi:hypothetical protein PCIT_b0918 [Pseudoalteromonas citrea]|uniref:Uncharacterized protein n=1 Tax=Pseudoalteromonas citrea TaxID=43655 RepID=A0AAD4AFD5_9GAMM|nr:hypothetical protein PCIT_b0918 [Pseudoalteromonas citrea]